MDRETRNLDGDESSEPRVRPRTRTAAAVLRPPAVPQPAGRTRSLDALRCAGILAFLGLVAVIGLAGWDLDQHLARSYLADARQDPDRAFALIFRREPPPGVEILEASGAQGWYGGALALRLRVRPTSLRYLLPAGVLSVGHRVTDEALLGWSYPPVATQDLVRAARQARSPTVYSLPTENAMGSTRVILDGERSLAYVFYQGF